MTLSYTTASWFLVVVSLFQVAIADHDGVLTCFGMKKGEAVVISLLYHTASCILMS